MASSCAGGHEHGRRQSWADARHGRRNFWRPPVPDGDQLRADDLVSPLAHVCTRGRTPARSCATRAWCHFAVDHMYAKQGDT